MSDDNGRLFDAEKMWENACDRTTDEAEIALYGGMRMATRIRLGLNEPADGEAWIARIEVVVRATAAAPEWTHPWCALQAVRSELLALGATS